MEKKDNKGIVIILSIVILVLTGTIIYMIYNNNLKNNNVQKPSSEENNKVNNDNGDKNDKNENDNGDKNDKNENDNGDKNDIDTSNEFVEISVDDPIVLSSMNLILKSNVNKREMSSCLLQDRLWNQNNANINTLDDDSILELIWNNVSEKDKKTFDNGNSYVIEEVVFKNTAKKVFGEGYRIPEQTKTSINCSYTMKYDSNNKNYVFSIVGTGDSLLMGVTNYYESAEKNNNTLIVIEKVGFYFEGNLYSKPTLGNIIVNGNVTNTNIMDYRDKFATYKYTFKLGNDNQYYFDNMTKTN